MKYYQQTGVNDCAPACLAIVALYYCSSVSIGYIRKLCKTDFMGTNFAGLIAAAEKPGFRAKAFNGEKTEKTLDSKIIFPFIARIKIQYLGNTYDQFVVINEAFPKLRFWERNLEMSLSQNRAR